MTTDSGPQDFEGATFIRTSFKSATLRSCDVSGVTMRSVDVAGLDIDSHDLFFASPFDSDYEAFGDSCGNRNEPAGSCVELYG